MASRWDLLKRRGGAPVMMLFRFAVYAGQFLLFFGVMSIPNWQLLVPNRTTATTVLTWTIMTAAMQAVYGGYEVGRKKSRAITANMGLSAVITDLVTYVQLQIMNVNPNNRSHFTLLGGDAGYLALCVIAQLALVALLVRLGNEVYFRINPPRRCMLILGSMAQRTALERKIGKYRLQWQVTDVALWNEPDLAERIDRVQVVLLAGVPDERRLELMKACYDLRRDVLCRAQLQDVMIAGARHVVLDDAPFLEMDYHKMNLTQRLVKRWMDIVLSLTVLVLLMPAMLIIALAIRLEDGGAVLYRQKRLTMGGREFTICKFRTMRAETGAAPTSAVRGDERVTRVGAVLRRLRLDELPQLWNILRGDMSLVGPRPEMMENVARYKIELPTFAYREKMKAGLTGYAQIEGRYNTAPEDKLMLDLMYIEQFSIWEDIRLLLRTVTVLFRKDSTEGFEQDAAAKNESAAARKRSEIK